MTLFLLLLVTAAGVSRRRAAALALVTLGAVLSIQFGLFRAIGVRSYHPAYRDQTILHQVAAAMRPGTAFDSADYAALSRLMPLRTWLDGYRCESVISTLAGVLAQTSETDYDRLRPGLRRAWWHALTRSPGVVARHHACVSGMIWNPSADFYLVGTTIVANGHGLYTNPVLPDANRALTAFVATTSHGLWRLIFWDPAAHLLVVAVALAWSLVRHADRLELLALSVPLLHSAVLVVAIPSAEYRLQYSVVLASLSTPLICFCITSPERTASHRVDPPHS